MAKTILIVDDSPTQMRLMQEALNGQGYHIITATTGDEAVEKVDRDKPDLVLLDVIMPGKNGFQVCRALKKKATNTKIILVTSKDQASDKFWGKKQGADDYVTKPFDATHLLATVRKYA